MFVVATVQRNETIPAGPDGQHARQFPVVFEDDELPHATGAIAYRDTREAAQKLADALNKALET
jgi:hypothetical protein